MDGRPHRGLGHMALTPRKREHRSPANDNGHAAGWNPPGRRWRDRRKSARLYRDWDKFRPSGHLPASSMLSQIAENGLSECCVSGRFEGADLEPAIESIGDYFSTRLNAAPGELKDELYPASVLLGKFMQLSAALLAKPHPHFDEGSFATPEAKRVLYGLVILPFAEDARSVDRWLALGSWRMDESFGEAPQAS